MIKLISLITGRKIVYLEDFEGKIYKTLQVKKMNPFTKEPYCYVYWLERVGFVNLHKDGSTSGRSYIKKWTY